MPTVNYRRPRELMDNRIGEQRSKLGITQEELAKITGMTRRAIAEFEAGTRRLNEKVVRKLTAALDCGFADLIVVD